MISICRNNDTQDTHERERESLVKSLKHEKDQRIILQQKYDDIKRDGDKKDKKIAFLEANEKQLRQVINLRVETTDRLMNLSIDQFSYLYIIY